MLTKYSPSGLVSPRLFVALVPMLLVAAASGLAYAWLSNHAPGIHLRSLIILGFGSVLYFTVGLTVHHGRCRNPITGVVVALLAAAAAIIAAHALNYHALAKTSTTPLSLLDYMHIAATKGIRLIRRHRISGIWAYVVWTVELLVACAAAIAAATESIREPFCETCRCHADTELLTFSIPGLSPSAIDRIAKADDIGPLLTPPLEQIHDSSTSLRYSLTHCPACTDRAYLTLTRIEIKQSRRSSKQSETTLGIAILLQGPEVEAVIQLAADVQAILDRQPKVLDPNH